ncbi:MULTISPECIES: molybdopterin-containing oxidoreductase family protein [Mycobacterium]|uniref:Formate dehydrogenase n=1 Tax=Mycobacterium kiyosense TaxID=2871094 RepID=A0A9P3UY55_9MYCO|nr:MULTISPECIES: molybdopterin-dependent oxidoreductase [Mycobacterium]BDB39738.1 formate dehydrogenase [Mycobacterium kiyosense]BDE11593.1 formate dehydrogenase [Mycobacterium sp. 20KCMC460]GLB81871.1 formate dehydrogenase [Mycobacterium kiyosense]GLB88169.1 formate dehydrogenase [Mycobacterium kiyosense]GLB95729.1 formate dehydrogenase [Mycobacterium kiyosense]
MAGQGVHKPTFCRICEPLCGMVATVEDGKLVSLRPDKQHPLSAGFACQKGIAFTEVVNDPDRVQTPLRRTASGFEPVTWETALDDIAARVAAIHRRHGSGAFGWYLGNPAAFSYSHLFGAMSFIKGIGRHSHFFTSSSQDTSSRLIASQLLYGSPMSVPIPDLTRTDLLVLMGANPIVSHGSFLTAPRINDRLHDIVKRGGRVIVVDPRRSETAAQFEWLGIVPDSDAYLLLSLLQVMFTEGLADDVATRADGVDWLRAQAAPFTPEQTESRTGIPPATVRNLARTLANTPRAALYGRLGTCVGRQGTLTTYLIDAVNLIAGNLDRPGGSVFGTLGMPGQKWGLKLMGWSLRRSYQRNRTRVGGFGTAIGAEPAALMAKEITTPGTRQIRALFVGAGNPVLSVPNGDELERAVDELDLMVGLDLYVNETTAHCDYVLPVTTMYERDDFALTFQTFQATPFRQVTEAVVEPVGQARTEWDIITDLISRIPARTPAFAALSTLRRTLAAVGRQMQPRPVVDMMIRMSEGGNRFGLRRSGLTFRRLAERHPHGVVVAPHLRTGVLNEVVAYGNGRIRLHHNDVESELVAMSRRTWSPDYPLRLIGMRESRSENSWLHNSPLLMRGNRSQRALMHADDAARRGIGEGDTVTVRSPFGQIAIAVTVTTDLVPGTVAVPHGWGHKGTGSWQLANRAGGANVNQLTSSNPADLEALAGMSWLTGVPVEVAVLDQMGAG